MNFLSAIQNYAPLLNHTTTVLIGVSVIGMLLGLVGAIALLRREVLLGDTVAHGTLVGVVVAFLVADSRSFPLLFLGACISALVGFLLVKLLTLHRFVPTDAAFAVVLSGLFGAGLIGLRYAQTHPGAVSAAGLESFIFGKASLITSSELFTASTVLIFTLITVYLARRSLAALCFDSRGLIPFAPQVTGARVTFAVLGLAAVAAALPATGVILTCSLLITPGVTARLFVRTFPGYLILSTLLGAGIAVVGALISLWISDVSTGASITITGTATLVTALVVRHIRRLCIDPWIARAKLSRARAHSGATPL